MAAQPVQSGSIPQGSYFVMPPTPTADRAQIRADFQAAAGHDKFVLIFPDGQGSPAGVVTTEEMQATLEATLGDSVKDQLIAEARAVAATVASEAVAQSGGHVTGPK